MILYLNDFIFPLNDFIVFIRAATSSRLIDESIGGKSMATAGKFFELQQQHAALTLMHQYEQSNKVTQNQTSVTDLTVLQNKYLY